MADITTITKAKADEILGQSVVRGDIDQANGHLILGRNNGSTVDAGDLKAISEAQLAELDARIDALESKQLFPVGSIYMGTTNTNPAQWYGGTWVEWGSGRVPVGVNSADTALDTPEETGGAKTKNVPNHQHIVPDHAHGISNLRGQLDAWSNNASGGGSLMHVTSAGLRSDGQTVGSGAFWTDARGGHDVDVMQPYITCYMWKRTA